METATDRRDSVHGILRVAQKTPNAAIDLDSLPNDLYLYNRRPEHIDLHVRATYVSLLAES